MTSYRNLMKGYAERLDLDSVKKVIYLLVYIAPPPTPPPNLREYPGFAQAWKELKNYSKAL